MSSKKSSRLNDTAVIARDMGPDALNRNESTSMSCRKIQNGYIISQSSYKDGRHESEEYFSESPPKSEGGEPPNPMARAVDFMRRNGTL